MYAKVVSNQKFTEFSYTFYVFRTGVILRTLNVISIPFRASKKAEYQSLSTEVVPVEQWRTLVLEKIVLDTFYN